MADEASVPAIAVLRFEGSDGREEGWLSNGFVEDIIYELSRCSPVGVIAADTTLRGGGTKPLNARWLLRGSLRRMGGVIRISVQLVEAVDESVLWAERYDVSGDEVLKAQDDIVARAASALAQRIDQTVLKRARKRCLTTLPAYECWLRGMEWVQRGTVEADEEARRCFERALVVDPGFARAHCGIALTYFNEWSCQAWDLWEEKERLAHESALRAEALDPEDGVIQAILARIEQYRRAFDRAEARLERAHRAAPHDVFVLIQVAGGLAFQGDPARGWNLAQRALELNPCCPGWFYYFAMIAVFGMRRYDEALEMAGRAELLIVDAPAYEAAAWAYLNQRERAASALARFEENVRERIGRGRSVSQEEAVRWLRHVSPFRRNEDLAHLLEGIRRAGWGEASEAKDALPLAWPIANVFRKEGELWTLSYERQVAQAVERRGFWDIAQLLARPNEEVHCMTLIGPERVEASSLPHLDAAARASYRERLNELDAELAVAEEQGDPARIERVAEERGALVHELERATGRGGRERGSHGTVERARTAVTWRIRDAIRKLERVHEPLSRHLSRSIRTGTFCSYAPEKAATWQVEG